MGAETEEQKEQTETKEQDKAELGMKLETTEQEQHGP